MKQIYYIVLGSDYMPDDEELERAPLIDEPDDPPESRHKVTRWLPVK